MKNLPFITVLLLIFGSLQTFSQLYMPLEFQRAYADSTRSFDGKPGIKYWQNTANYIIDVEVVPKTWKISGKESVVYVNNSPDSLTRIVIQTLANHYKKGAIRDTPVDGNLTEGIQLSNLLIDDDTVKLDDNNRVEVHSTFIIIELSTKLPPKQSLNLSVNWETELPLKFKVRYGAYDENTAFMAYFYPKVGVYDDIDGWDYHEFFGLSEFYCDYANFEVNIKLPGNYKAWGVGTLTNEKEILDDKTLKKLEISRISNSTIVIDEGGEYAMPVTPSRIWKFKAENVLDFAVGISNNFRWEASCVKLKDKTIYSNLIYDPKEAYSLKELLLNQNVAIKYFSDSNPGITYPYHQFTTFIGAPEYHGMEFPMLANNGLYRDSIGFFTENLGVDAHEVAHAYTPFYVGINEVKYAWLEEGLTTFLGIEFINCFESNNINAEDGWKSNLTWYTYDAGKHWESPLFSPSNHHNYDYMVYQLTYMKPAVMFYILMDLLGKEAFLFCYQSFINRWAGKHATPYDFMFTFNDISKQNLDWFWKPWIFEYGYPDLAIKEVKDSKIFIINNGTLPVPVDIKISYTDSTEVLIHKTANVWSKGNKIIEVELSDTTQIKTIELITDMTPDIDKSNNLIIW